MKHSHIGNMELELPKVPEAEKGLCSIVLNFPEPSMLVCSEKGFLTSDIFDPQYRLIVETVFQLCASNKSTDIRVIYERIRETNTSIEFFDLSELYTVCPIAATLPDLIEIVKTTAKRRASIIVLHQAGSDLRSKPLNDVISAIIGDLEAINNELVPQKATDTRTLLMEATQRYETGDDQSMRIKTGFEELDNITPIRYSDFVVVGGETKSGKTTLVLNIIANLI